MTLPGDGGDSTTRRLCHYEHLRTLRRVIVMVAETFDKGRIAGFEREYAMLCQIFGYPGQREWTVDTIGHGCGRCRGSPTQALVQMYPGLQRRPLP